MAGIDVRGLRDLNRALRFADRDVRLGIRKELRGIAEPVARSAEVLAVEKIPRIGVAWSRMRVGQTQRAVYVAPKQRGVKGRGHARRRRPNLNPLLLNRSMLPALERHEPELVANFDRMLHRVADNFNR